MNNSLPYLIFGAIIALLAWILPLQAETAGSNDDLLPLIEAISSQQKAIDDNQAAIEKSLSTIQENLRQAKIYISRAGGKSAK